MVRCKCGKHYNDISELIKCDCNVPKGDSLNAVLADVGERLLPCPFCGGEGRQAMGKDMDGEEFYFIHCKCCASESGWGRSKGTAVMIWNKRANVS